MQQHRLGFPAVLRALAHNLPAEPAKAGPGVTPQPVRPMLAHHTKAHDAAETAHWEREHPIAAVIASLPDAPYRPEGFDFAYVSGAASGGASTPPLPSLDPGRVMPEDVHGESVALTNFKDREQAAFEEWLDRTRPSGDHESVQRQWVNSVECAEFLDAEQLAETQPTAPTEWQSGPPPEKGWRMTRYSDQGAKEVARYFGGYGWGTCVIGGDGILERIRCAATSQAPVHATAAIQWRGPRLTGADWPEPQQ